jgi:hypothetical protein
MTDNDILDQITLYLTEENKTGLPDSFTVIDPNIRTSSGKPVKGNTYHINVGDKTVLKAEGEGKDWFIVTTGILKVAFKEGKVK